MGTSQGLTCSMNLSNVTATIVFPFKEKLRRTRKAGGIWILKNYKLKDREKLKIARSSSIFILWPLHWKNWKKYGESQGILFRGKVGGHIFIRFHFKFTIMRGQVQITAFQRNCAKVLFSVMCVWHSVHKDGFPCDHYPWRHYSVTGHMGTPSPSQSPGHTQACLLGNLHIPRHVQTCSLWSPRHLLASGRLAFYWNAFLLFLSSEVWNVIK